MKLRIKGNALRIRISKIELERFGQEGLLEERSEIGEGVLIYRLESCSTRKDLCAEFQNQVVTVWVPGEMTAAWVNTSVVGFERNGTDTSVLIEKDFVCIDNTDEDHSDNFPNPKMVC
jgi:hypothetical protein